MKKLVIFMMMQLLCLASFAQLKPLKLGDQVPDLDYQLLNRPGPAAKLSGYKGKLLIIDCWNIYCAPCIEALPGLAKLRETFKDRINILAWEGGSELVKVREFLSKRKTDGKEVALPVAYSGSYKTSKMFQLFPVLHYGFPVELWINEKGILIGITRSAFVNEAMIKRVLSGDYSGLEETHYQLSFNKDKPLLVGGNGGPDSIFNYRALITPFIDSIPTVSYLSAVQNSRYTRLFYANQPISELVKLASYKGKLPDNFNKFLKLDVADSARYLFPNSRGQLFRETMKKQGYCYELILPPGRKLEDTYGFMLADLQRYFNIDVQFKMLPVKCLVLKRLSPDACRSTTEKESVSRTTGSGTYRLTLRHYRFSTFLSQINSRSFPVLVDQTGIDYPIDLDITFPKEYNFEQVSKELERVGIQATEQFMDKQVLVISGHK